MSNKLTNSARSCALLDAVVREDLAEVNRLVAEGADVNARSGDEQQNTPLHITSNTSIAQLLIKAGADIEATNNLGMTPLMFHVNRHTVDIVQILLGKGADVDATDQKGMTALAICEKGLELTKRLQSEESKPTLAKAIVADQMIANLLRRRETPAVKSTDPMNARFRECADALETLITRRNEVFILPEEQGITNTFLDGHTLSRDSIAETLRKFLFGLRGQAEAWKTGCFRGQNVTRTQLLQGLSGLIKDWEKTLKAWMIYSLGGEGMERLRVLCDVTKQLSYEAQTAPFPD